MNGILRHRTDATNADLVRDVVAATDYATDKVGTLPRNSAARMCHGFLRDHITYIEERDDQYTRAPWRTIKDGRADCKSFAVFVGSICAASGCHVQLKFVVLPGDVHFGHVFAVVDGVADDPCLEFGDECTYIASRTVTIHHA